MAFLRRESKDTVADVFSGTSMAVRCYESHPALKLGTGTLYGGCARTPKIKDADVYVVLQSGDLNGVQSDPWEPLLRTEVYYGIRDMEAPQNVPRFKKLVTWVCNQLHDGKTVHVGCIGGHGRTGTVLSAIVAEMLGEKDAVQYVRKHYCKKAVESRVQVQFLMKHYGVSEVEPAKVPVPVQKWSKDETVLPWEKRPVGVAWSALELPPKKSSAPEGRIRRIDPVGLTMATKSFGPMASTRSLWKSKKRK